MGLNTELRHNVRAAIVNDLGLTREDIRKEMRELVNSTVETQLSKLDLERVVENMIGRVIADKINPRMPTTQIIDSVILRAAGEVIGALIKEKVQNNLAINLQVKPEMASADEW